MDEFPRFPSIPRLFRDCIITEKIDGTNALIHIDEKANIRAGSRNRWITVQEDNYGFAQWVEENKDQLIELGPGTHYGEWYGYKIGRTYGLSERRFALFNTPRWAGKAPECCETVPVLYEGLFDTEVVRRVLRALHELGSVAVPSFDRPEGVVVFHKTSKQVFKITLDNNDNHKFMV